MSRRLGDLAARPDNALGALLTGLIDYAGLFPPAALPMAEAVGNFTAYRQRDESWMLGRFVVPVSRLGEFASALAALPAAAGDARWELSALPGGNLDADLAAVAEFNANHGGAAAIVALETPAETPARVAQLRGIIPASYELYLELPLSPSLPPLVDAVGAAGAYAKIRTGGIRPEDFPSADAVGAFLSTCADARLPFKATAGLHHPTRGLAPLTYQPGSACATMFGYLNVFLAAAVLWDGRPRAEALQLLLEQDRSRLTLHDDAVEWAGIRIPSALLGRARREFARSIGSCSFTEPVEEIRALGARLDSVPAGRHA